MSTIIKCAGKPEDLSSVIHHMPCNIQHAGDARVSDYFLPTIRKDKPKATENSFEQSNNSENFIHSTAAFRGRPLNGKEIKLPDDYTGLILEERLPRVHSSLSNGNNEAKQVPEWNIVGKFDSLAYWNWDKVPSAEDGIPQLFQWTRLANAAQTSARSFLTTGDDFIDSDNETS